MDGGEQRPYLIRKHSIDLAIKFCMTLASWKDKHQDTYLSIQKANEILSVTKSSLIPIILKNLAAERIW